MSFIIAKSSSDTPPPDDEPPPLDNKEIISNISFAELACMLVTSFQLKVKTFFLDALNLIHPEFVVHLTFILSCAVAETDPYF